MQTHLAIVKLLADGDFHSGEALASALGITRAGVWKAVRKAADTLGLPVESVRGRGYRLAAPLELLDPEPILAAVDHRLQGHIARLEIHDDIDSTNSHLMREARAGAPSGCVCLAERQSAGRGRHGRSWVSPFGANLYLSLLWRYAIGPAQLGGLSLAAGTAVAGALRDEGVANVALKWPNDVLWQRHKLAGLLIDVAGESEGPSLVVVGVGINTRLDPGQAAAIDQPWTDLHTAVGEGACSRNRLAGRTIARLVEAAERYGREGLAPFIADWERFDLHRGEPVELRIGERVTAGIHAGITAEGALRLRTESGERTFQAGEVSLRPLG